MQTELERILLEFSKEKMVAYMDAHPEMYGHAAELALENRQPFAWRAAWLLGSITGENDPRIKEYLPGIISCISGKRDGHKRELLRILLLMDLDQEQEGRVFDICMDVWEKLSAAPSVRYTALRMIFRIARKYPELFNDIAFITQEHYLETLSPGIRNAVLRMLEETGGEASKAADL